MSAELNCLLTRLNDVVERMPDCFNTYEFAQKLALHYQPEFFAAGHSLAQHEGKTLRILHQKIAEALASSEGVIEGALLPCVTPWGEKASSPRWHRKF
ncbi:hypothetical protein [Aeromonas cavernicola]|uniref:Uncharacterized protein n=1 Tax=Aeromonas cavernicola TaxID=1006623 RepID=A0A2H9U636_9GAMM|nr:hypothetical protein [Aeromonas cavernicola]PJG59516.1 hypothetical protein CUC53_06845 [Aeromonas cavernicola]